MKISHLSLRRLSVVLSLAVVLLYVLGYLMFKYFWDYDQAINQARQLQAQEVARVKSALNIQSSDLGETLTGYAAWDDMAEFVSSEKSAPDFTDSALSRFIFQSRSLDGIFIFTPDVQLKWGKRFSPERARFIPLGIVRYQFGTLLAETLRSRTDKITPMVKFMVLNKEPYLMATSRICSSMGDDCTSGYMAMMKKVRSQFLDEISASTGIGVGIRVAPLEEISELKTEQDVSYIVTNDFERRYGVILSVYHRVKMPEFVVAGELIALAGFAIVMFLLNLFGASLLVAPINRAQAMLQGFRKTGTMPDDTGFFSLEMKNFAKNINQLVYELESSRKKLTWQSAHDPLTGAANRRELERVLKMQIATGSYRYLTLMLLDIDHFKRFNDNYSHLDGDAALQQVAAALIDMETPYEKLVARFGGEEFCICLFSNEEIPPEREAERILQLIEALAIPHGFSPTKPVLSVSIGATQAYKTRLGEYQRLFHIADQALYQAKNSGRACYFIDYHPSMARRETCPL